MKTMFIAIFLFVSNCLFAQSYSEAFRVQLGTYDKLKSKWEWGKAEDRNIEFKLDGVKVYIYNNANTILTTYEDLGEESKYDEDGDPYKIHKWRATDDQLRKCIFYMVYYKELPIIIYTVMYNDIAFRFYIRNNKLSNF
jgi:hypothetical protein